MKSIFKICLYIICFGYSGIWLVKAQQRIDTTIPTEWIEPSTGHKVVRLTRSGTENMSFYFHNKPFLKSKDGAGYIMVYYGKINNTRQLFTIDLNTLENVQITDGVGRKYGEIIAPINREVVYQIGDSVMATNVDTRQTRLIHVFPKGLGARIFSMNSNETLIAGKYNEGNKVQDILLEYPEKHDYFSRIYNAKIKHSLFILNVQTHEMKVIHEENDWTNHIQFSPTDPDLLMYCHEGPWHKVDRIWTINVKTGENKLMHKRTMDMEIAGHEFFSPDGKTIWFDLQQPRSVTFYLAGVDLATGMEKKYSLSRDEWSIHYNISPDQNLFCGDGGDSSQVAKAKNGRWIYLFRPQGHRFVSERLVNMQNHGYKLEPNVHFSPDGKWVIFRSNMHGETYIYAVELKKNIN
jgi:oligogalacturonide lyase